MSELLALCNALDQVIQPLPALTDQLQQRAARLRSLAVEVQVAAREVPNGPDCSSVAAGLYEAAHGLEASANALSAAVQQGRSYIQRTVAGDSGGSASPQHQSDGGDAPADVGAATRDGSGRYVHPGPMVEARFQQLVSIFGATNPSGWIDAGNPNYANGLDMWMNNCGPCSQSFADTFHGKSAMPAMGDAHLPPGEYQEMWDAVGVTPKSRMTNVHAEPADFQASAFQALEASLQREGPGAVAIIGVDWDVPGIPRGQAGGHWFNAYVDSDGTVKWADQQIGKLDGWPPVYQSEIWQLEAVVRPSADEQWKELVL